MAWQGRAFLASVHIRHENHRTLASSHSYTMHLDGHREMSSGFAIVKPCVVVTLDPLSLPSVARHSKAKRFTPQQLVNSSLELLVSLLTQEGVSPAPSMKLSCPPMPLIQRTPDRLSAPLAPAKRPNHSLRQHRCPLHNESQPRNPPP